MRPPVWHPPVELSAAEQVIIKRIRRAKLFVFLRERRHEIFADAFQEELARLYKDSSLGQPPVPPAQLALATLLQAYTGVSDDEVIEATTMDRRWQLVLDCHDCTEPPFSKGTLVAFRKRLIAQDFDRRLIERTVAVAETTAKPLNRLRCERDLRHEHYRLFSLPEPFRDSLHVYFGLSTARNA